MTIRRRDFVGFGSTLAAGAALGFTGLLSGLAEARTYGGLKLDPARILDLPAGFEYKILQRHGDKMSDGRMVRPAPDGMAAFPGEDGTWILMRNHELPGGFGGVSRVVLDPKTLRVISSNDVLVGTNFNCAGGPSPWGWLSAEEEADVGGVWLCPTDAKELLTGDKRRRIASYGSFKHEAVAIDPVTFTAYLTEDDGEGYLYRMVPKDPKKDPFVGKLQAARRKAATDFNTRGMKVGESLELDWVDVSPDTPRRDAKRQGATIFTRGEGIWWFDGEVYFTATYYSQVFRVTPGADGGKVTLVANDFKNPDNITVAPWGDLFVAEDSQDYCRIRIVEKSGKVTNFARNAIGPGEELTGVCFSPDGSVLFVNMQKAGLTIAITGPFDGIAKKAEPGAAPTPAPKEPEAAVKTESSTKSGGCSLEPGAGPSAGAVVAAAGVAAVLLRKARRPS